MGYNKAVDGDALDVKLKNIADRLRLKRHMSSTFTIEEMPAAITAISRKDLLVNRIEEMYVRVQSYHKGSYPDNITLTEFKALLNDNTGKVYYTDLPSNLISTITTECQLNDVLFLTELPSSIFPSGKIPSGAFSRCNSLAINALPAYITEIGDGAFNECPNLSLEDLPKNVTTIGTAAFNGCPNIDLRSFPTTLNSLGTSAFKGCSGLREVKLLYNLDTIPPSCFEGCSNLNTMTTYATNINQSAFRGCTSLTSISLYNDSVVQLSESVTATFYSTRLDAHYGSICVPKKLYDSYCNDTKWSPYKAYIAGVFN